MANSLEFAILYLLVFYFPANILAVFNNDQNTPETFEIENTQFIEPKMFYYDKFGYLIVDGKVPGMSSPIVLDYKKYMNSCTSNIHYFFSFVVPDADTVEQVEFLAQNSSLMQSDVAEMLSTCPYGLTFCYEGQMDGSGTYRQFQVDNYISEDGNDTDLPSQKIAFQCMLTNNILNAHGFNMAVVAFPGLDPSKIKAAKDVKLDLSKYRCTYRFFVFTLSITREEYYFLVPDNGRIMSQIGDSKTFRSYFTDSAANELPPLQFEYGGEKYGTTTFGNVEDSDPENGDFHDGNRGLWMLYLDFKRRYNELQVVTSVHSEDCDMHVEIRGTRMRKCRSYLQDIVVTEPSDVELDFMYTSEVGTIKKTEQGSEDLQEFLKKKEQERMRKTTTKTESKNKTESSKSETTSKGEKRVKETHKSSQTKLHASASATVSGQYSKPPVTRPPNNGPKRPGQGPPPPSGPGGQGSSPKNSNTGGNRNTGSGGGGGNNNRRGGNGNGNNRRRGGGGGGGDSRSRKAEQFLNGGKEFLGQAVQNGLVNDAIKMINDGSALGKIKEGVMREVNNGINTLQGLVKQGEMAATNLVNTAKAYGDNLYKKGRAEVDKIKNQANNAVNDVTGKINEYKQIGQQKAGQIASGVGSLLSKSMDYGNGMMNKAGQQIGKMASQGSAAMEKFTGNMQNLIPTDIGGSMQKIGDKAKSLVPNGVKIPQINIPGGINLENGRKLTQPFLDNMPGGIKFLSSFSDVTNKINMPKMPNMDNIKNVGSNVEQKLRQTGGSIVERGNNIIENAKKFDATKFTPDVSKWTNKGMDAVHGMTKFKIPGTQSISNPFPGKFGRRKREVFYGYNDNVFLHAEANFNGTINSDQEEEFIWEMDPQNAYYGNQSFSPRVQIIRRKRQSGQVNAGASGSASKTDGSESSSQHETDNSKTESNSERMFSDVSRSKSLMESFKSTTGTTDIMSTAEFVTTTQAFTTKETVDIKVQGLQPKQKIVLAQMMFECDGNVIKLPKLVFHNGHEEIKGLSETALGNKVRTLDTRQQAPKKKKDKKKPDDPKKPEKKPDEPPKPRQTRSVVAEMLDKGHSYRDEEQFAKLSFAEQVFLDPSILFEDDEEEEVFYDPTMNWEFDDDDD